MSKLRKPTTKTTNVLLSYLSVFALMGAALFLTFLIHDFVRPMISPLFLFAVVIIAWVHGLRHAILGTFIAGVLIDFFFIEPHTQFSMGLNDVIRLMIFFLEGVGFSLLINQRKLAADAVRKSREQLLALTLRESEAREEERKRVALEVHDELGQALTSLKLRLHMLKKSASEGAPAGPMEGLATQVDPLLDLVDGTIGTVRRIATELRPPVIDDLGLLPAIEWQIQEFRRLTGIKCTLRSNAENSLLPSQTSIAVFRIFQEALTNITRHAQATEVNVVLQQVDPQLELLIEDNGVGMGQIGQSGNLSLGLIGMRERARNIGGELQIMNGSGRGTVIRLTAPTKV